MACPLRGRHLAGFAFGSWLRHRFAALQAAHAKTKNQYDPLLANKAFGITEGFIFFALAAWRVAKPVRSTEPKASPEGSDPAKQGNAQVLLDVKNVFKHINIEGLCYKLIHTRTKRLFLHAIIA